MIRLLLLILAFPVLATAGERTFGNGTLPEHLAFYDADGSGALSVEELQILQEDRKQLQNRLRNRWDLNRDGKISLEEREAAKNQIRKTIEARRITRFNEVDRDRNGQLTLTEFKHITAVSASDDRTPGMAQRLFNNLDANKDGTVSTREFLLRLNTLPPDQAVDTTPTAHPKTPQPATTPTPR